MLLSAQNISKAFGSFLAVRGADLAVAEGEIIGLIGPNGAGKSTFFNCLAGDAVPTTGRVLFDGIDVTRASAEAHARAGIGRTFQVPATFEDMTVLENVMVGAFLRHHHRGTARETALRIVEMTGLARQSAQRARSLGTPGRKRLEIARVLATGPRLMLLDEALAGLTPTELQQAIALVRRIHELGITLVIVEHIMEVIMTLAQRVLVFNQGNAIAGLVQPSGGSIEWRGETITRQPAYIIVAKGLALSPEGWRLFVSQTVEQNLRLGAVVLADKSRMAALFERVYAMFPRLAERRHQLAGTLSGGERQMLALGRALMSEPRLLMLDEPSLGLAPGVVEALYETLDRLHKEGLTLLLAEQSIPLALDIADYAYVLQTGRTVLEGKAVDLEKNEQVQEIYLGIGTRAGAEGA